MWKLGTSGSTAGELNNWRAVLVKKWMKTLKYCKIHLLAAVWYMYARILEIWDQNSKKIFAGCNGLRVTSTFFSVKKKTQAPTVCVGQNNSKNQLKNTSTYKTEIFLASCHTTGDKIIFLFLVLKLGPVLRSRSSLEPPLSEWLQRRSRFFAGWTHF